MTGAHLSSVDEVGLEPAAGPTVELLDLLASWMPTTRWFPLKGVPVTISHVASFALPHGRPRRDDIMALTTHLLRLTPEAGTAVTVQVPVVYRAVTTGTAAPGSLPPAHRDPDSASLIGRILADGRPCDVYDAMREPVGWTAFLDGATWAGGTWAHQAGHLVEGHVLGGEQSNSSVILPTVPLPGLPLPHTSSGAILKVLRTVADGPNPDVAVPLALARTGWQGVPRPLAWVTVREDGRVTDPAADPAGRTLAVISELVPGARDGFELAVDYVRRGESFAGLARSLGQSLAEMHAALRRAFPVSEPADASWLIDDLRERGDAASSESEIIAERSAGIEAVWDHLAERLGSATSTPLPPLQTIHADLHLGQVLAGPDGWRFLDFEGEPARPVTQRSRPDLPQRDIAGILRSFDYATAMADAPEPGGVVPCRDRGEDSSTQEAKDARKAWTAEAGSAFLTAYLEADTSGTDPALTVDLVMALTLDKALYEVIYESRNRPDWVSIPLTAVDKLIGFESL